jgi:hypothetical protein
VFLPSDTGTPQIGAPVFALITLPEYNMYTPPYTFFCYDTSNDAFFQEEGGNIFLYLHNKNMML